LVVKEGNRRVAALKIILGLIPLEEISVPPHLEEKIQALKVVRKREFAKILCTIYEPSDETLVDRIVTLAHGYSDQAAKDKWKAVARARHARKMSNAKTPALDLLEKYIAEGTNVTRAEHDLWSGDYPITILEAAMQKLAVRLGASNAPDLADKYPNIKYRDGLEGIMKSIGNGGIGFEHIRHKTEDFAKDYGIPPLPASPTSTSSAPTPGSPAPPVGGSTSGSSSTSATSTASTPATPAPPAPSHSTPRHVKMLLRSLTPRGPHRGKLTALRDEAISLNIKTHPLAFCLVLRSMIELSAKLYCEDKKADPKAPTTVDKNGRDKRLTDLVAEVHKYMVEPPGQKKNAVLERELHGAITEILTPTSILSVTALNLTAHGPTFSVSTEHICVTFANLYPLLSAMNDT
jgi:hypothetical protein